MSDWLPSLYALRAYEVVARHLSYKSAAHELNVTPAAVKQLVVKLETALDTKLVKREGHALVLTQAGAAGQDDMRRAMRHMSQAVHKMRRSQKGTRLILSVEASIATTWLVPRLEQFRAQHPGIDVFIDSSQKVIDLRREGVDIAIRYGVPRQEGLVAQRLFKDLVLPACSPRLIEQSHCLRQLSDLQDVPLIHWDLAQIPWAEKTREWFDWEAWLDRRGLPTGSSKKGLRFSDYGLAVQAAISGQGVLLAGWPALQDPLQAGLLVCPFPHEAQTTDVGFDVVTAMETAERPEVTLFVKWLTATAKHSASSLSALDTRRT